MADNQEVTVQVHFQSADYWRANCYLRNRSFRIWFFRAVLIVTPWLIVLYKYQTDGEGWTWWVLLVPAFFALFLLLIAPLIDRVFLQRKMQSIPSAFSPQLWVLSDTGIQITGQDEHVELKWGAIVKAAESATDFFLYVGNSMAHFIPKRCMLEGSQKSLLREILKRNLGEKAALAKPNY